MLLKVHLSNRLKKYMKRGKGAAKESVHSFRFPNQLIIHHLLHHII